MWHDFTCPGCGLRGAIDDDQATGRISIECPQCGWHQTMNVLQRLLGRSAAMSDQPSERDQLIAAAQDAGVPSPWFKSNEDLRAAIEAAGQAPAAADAALAADEADEAADAAFTPPAEGADAPDPYAHLGSNAPTGDEPEETEA